MFLGLLAAGMTMGVAAVFPEALMFPFFAGVLGLLSGVYPGMAMAAPEGGRRAFHWIAALLCVMPGLVGLWRSPLLLVAGWALHWLWSVLNRFTGLGDGVPDSFPDFCLSYDLVTAGFVAYIWAVGV